MVASPYFSFFLQNLIGAFQYQCGNVAWEKTSVQEGNSAFLVVESRCMKISVALLRQPFSAFFFFLKKFDICVRKSVLHGCVSFFHLLFWKFHGCVSRSVWHCCMRKVSCIRRKLSFFGGGIWMCENQCCVVASGFSAFFFFLKKSDICVRKSVLRGCFTPFQFFFSQNFTGAFPN